MQHPSFPVIKYSWAITDNTTETGIPWNHVNKNQLAVMLQNDTFGSSSMQQTPSVVMRVLHEKRVLEQVNVENLCRRASIAIAAATASGLNLPQSDVSISAIVRNPLLALKYESENGKVRRLQFKFASEMDCEEVVHCLSDLKCPIKYTEARQPVVYASQATLGSNSKHTVEPSIINDSSCAERFSSSSHNVHAFQPPLGNLQRTATSRIDVPTNSISRSPRSNSNITRNEGPPTPFSLVRSETTLHPRSRFDDELLRPHSASVLERRQIAYDRSWNPQSRSSAHFAPNAISADSISNESWITVRSSLEKPSSPLPVPESCSSPVRWSRSSTLGLADQPQRPATADSLALFLPPRRVLPFDKRPMSSLVEVRDDAPVPRPLSSALNLPPLPAPTFSRHTSVASVAHGVPVKAAGSDSVRPHPTNALSSSGYTEPRHPLRSMEANSVPSNSQPTSMNSFRAQSLQSSTAGALTLGDVVYERLGHRPTHAQTDAAIAHDPQTATAALQSNTNSNVANMTTDQERLGAYATQPESTRQAVLDAMICKYINDDNFLTLCQDMENSWRRIGLHREN